MNVFLKTIHTTARPQHPREPDIHYEIYKKGFDDAKHEIATLFAEQMDPVEKNFIEITTGPFLDETYEADEGDEYVSSREEEQLLAELEKEQIRSESLLRQNQDLIAQLWNEKMAKRIP